MFLNSLNLQNFRSYSSKSVDFLSNVNLIFGPNGSGKTNILEAIFLLSGANSFRASRLAQMISWQKNFASIQGKLNKNNENNDLEVQLIKQDANRISVSRRFLVQKVQKTRKFFLSHLKAVLFHPGDIRLVSGSPSRRRDFIDSFLSRLEWSYASALSQYNKSIKHRNELLDLIFQKQASVNELFFWDQSLIKNGNILYQYRKKFFESANSFFKQNKNIQIQQISLQYLTSIISKEKLDSNLNFDIKNKNTGFGPHRDDYQFDNISFPSEDKNLANWGSGGQQRLAVLALKLAQVNYIESNYNQTPILLLDDIFSELDQDHRHLVVSLCKNHQVFITTSSPRVQKLLPSAKAFYL
ncbi:DNA replication and repair protein RecF [Patescibacteria group bacterium]|nr:DNA replication and repair protein RecF [Patescibacteria group bacterium]